MPDIKQVKIHLQTTVTNGSDKETYELLTFGTLQKKGQSLYLKYEEVQEDLQTTNAIVKWSEEEVFIMRSGHVNMRQKFIKDVMTQSMFESPLGALQMLTTAKSMHLRVGPSQADGEMKLIYDLAIQGSDVGEYEMKITFKEEAK